MAGRIFPIPIRRWKPAYGAILAIVALCLRLVVPAPMLAAAAATTPLDLVAAFGEHALCIAAAAERGTEAPDAPAPQHGDHADHDCPGCCTSMAQAAIILPRAPGVRIHFAPPLPIVALVEEPAAPNPYRTRPAEPTGPPVLG